ncbi:hypothetical protein [Paenibacillus polymyxa]|uniref:hypothetical protein n=1 Tax=Paenibacillus polymyxa TaxID=1406 RepID=UPI0023799A09|nr:hypothetical protein [Paenibacillus polymyxa]WDM21279.1 hypothetical protein J4I02_20275 [Paenibacillus polymyxa]
MRVTKCLCGNYAQLRFKDEFGRVKDKIVLIRNVPIFFYADCEEEYMTGPDSLKFADRVKISFESGIDEPEFQEGETGMDFDQEAFADYLEKMSAHLFGTNTLSQIIAQINDSHRARRFFTMYLLKNRETFFSYYQMRERLGISFIFDTIICALYYEREKKPVKQTLIDLLQIDLDMVNQQVDGYPLKEFNKDLNSFIFYWRKKTGRLLYPHKS